MSQSCTSYDAIEILPLDIFVCTYSWIKLVPSKKKIDWFGLVSLFNVISTFCRLFNAKAILLEEQ